MRGKPKLPGGKGKEDDIIALGTDRDFSGTDLRVFLVIIGNVGYDNIINISQSELTAQSNISQQNISKSIQKLISKGYLQVIDKIGRSLSELRAIFSWAFLG